MTIRGIQEAQAANVRMMAAVKPGGALGEAVRWGTTEAHRYCVSITHVDTGALRASHRMAFEGERGLIARGRSAFGRISIDPSAVNPRGQRPAEYGPVEHARGGSHAFYERTVREAGERIGFGMARMVRRGMG